MFLHFESPWFLLLLLLVPALVVRRILAGRAAGMPSLRYADLSRLEGLPRGWRINFQPLLPALRYLTLALVVIGLARPQAGQAHEIIHGEGVDIALALDISGSMAALDFSPDDRLGAAKKVIAQFVDERPYDRIGLIVFAATAFHQSPPTIDHDVLSRLLDQVRLSTELGIEDRTAMGIGLANAVNMLKDSSSKSKVVILLTDGVNNTGEIDPRTAAQAAKALSIKVYTIGMGKPGKVPVPVVDAFGQRTLTYRQSELDEDTLKAIAADTGGLYYRAEDTRGLMQIYDEINRMEKSQVEVQRYTNYRELAGWVLAPALVLFLREIALRSTLFRVLP